jgi:hypothetical protein
MPQRLRVFCFSAWTVGADGDVDAASLRCAVQRAARAQTGQAGLAQEESLLME